MNNRRILISALYKTGIGLLKKDNLDPTKMAVQYDDFLIEAKLVFDWIEDIKSLLSKLNLYDYLEILESHLNLGLSAKDFSNIKLIREKLKGLQTERNLIQLQINHLLGILSQIEIRTTIPTVTLDTNMIIHLSDYILKGEEPANFNIEDLLLIINAGMTGKILLAFTSRVKTDVLEDKKLDRRTRTLKYIDSFPVLSEIGSGFTLGFSRLGGKDFLVSEEYKKMSESIEKIICGNSPEDSGSRDNHLKDRDHLTAHKYAEREFFISTDFKEGKRKKLKVELGINVLSPSEFINLLGSF